MHIYKRQTDYQDRKWKFRDRFYLEIFTSLHNQRIDEIFYLHIFSIKKIVSKFQAKTNVNSCKTNAFAPFVYTRMNRGRRKERCRKQWAKISSAPTREQRTWTWAPCWAIRRLRTTRRTKRTNLRRWKWRVMPQRAIVRSKSMQTRPQYRMLRKTTIGDATVSVQATGRALPHNAPFSTSRAIMRHVSSCQPLHFILCFFMLASTCPVLLLAAFYCWLVLLLARFMDRCSKKSDAFPIFADPKHVWKRTLFSNTKLVLAMFWLEIWHIF